MIIYDISKLERRNKLVMHAQIALQLAKQFPDNSTPVTPEGVILIVAMFLTGCLIMYAAHDDLSRLHQ